MIKLVILFYQAEDNKALEDYFYNQYLPIAVKIPGVVKVEVTQLYTDLKKVFLKQEDLTPVYKILCEIYFEDFQSFEEGIRAPDGIAMTDSTVKIAWELVTVVLGDVITITPEEFEKNPTLIRRYRQNL